MNKQTASILKKYGVQPHLLGYDYLGEAIEIAREDRKKIRSTTSLYFDIAKKYDVTPSSVERAIRHAIEVAFDILNPDTIYELFGNSLDCRRSRPANSHFIAALAEQVEYSR